MICLRRCRCSSRLTSSIESAFRLPSVSPSNMRCCAMQSTKSLLRGKRQQIHADIASIIEKDFPELAENQPEVLAYHYQEAGNHQSAIRCWFESGQRALAHSANVEAIANFRKALQLLNEIPETPRTDQTRDRHSIGVRNSADRCSRICLSRGSGGVFAGSDLMPATGRPPRIFPGSIWAMGPLLDGRKE